MRRSHFKFGIIGFIFFILNSACSTSTTVMSVPGAEKFRGKTAYFASHGGRSEDMDQHIRRNLVDNHYAVQSGPDLPLTSGSDLLVKYSDQWKWDVTMYLNSFSIEFYNAKTGALLTRGEFKNSALHGYPDAGEVVKGVMDQMFTKLAIGKPN